MHFDKFSFGSVRIDGSIYEHDVVIDRGKIRRRRKKPSKKFRDLDTHRCRTKKKYRGTAGGW